MKATICFPLPPVELPTGGFVPRRNPVRFTLRWVLSHSASNYGLGVFLDAGNGIFDGHSFRSLRDDSGAWIETDDVPAATACLGLPIPEEGIREYRK